MDRVAMVPVTQVQDGTELNPLALCWDVHCLASSSPSLPGSCRREGRSGCGVCVPDVVAPPGSN